MGTLAGRHAARLGLASCSAGSRRPTSRRRSTPGVMVAGRPGQRPRMGAARSRGAPPHARRDARARDPLARRRGRRAGHLRAGAGAARASASCARPCCATCAATMASPRTPWRSRPRARVVAVWEEQRAARGRPRAEHRRHACRRPWRPRLRTRADRGCTRAPWTAGPRRSGPTRPRWWRCRSRPDSRIAGLLLVCDPRRARPAAAAHRRAGRRGPAHGRGACCASSARAARRRAARRCC